MYDFLDACTKCSFEKDFRIQRIYVSIPNFMRYTLSCMVCVSVFLFFYEWEHRTGTLRPFSSLYHLRQCQVIKQTAKISQKGNNNIYVEELPCNCISCSIITIAPVVQSKKKDRPPCNPISVIILFSFSFFFYAVLPLRFQLSCGKSVKYRFIEFFFFDYGSLPYLLSLLFLSGSYFSFSCS